MRRASVPFAVLLFAVSAPALAQESGTLFLSLRGGALIRSGGGYAQDAQVFGYDGMGDAGGATIEVGIEILPHLSVHGSYSQFDSQASHRISTLSLDSRAGLAHVRYAAWRDLWGSRGFANCMAQLQLSLGGGVYSLTENFDQVVRARLGAGLRAGVDFSVYWRWIGFVIGYGYNYAPISVDDRLGGTVEAGGHEITVGVSARL